MGSGQWQQSGAHICQKTASGSLNDFWLIVPAQEKLWITLTPPPDVKVLVLPVTGQLGLRRAASR